MTYCSWCGRNKPPYVSHHIAGDDNYPAWFARTCTGCHRILNAYQWAHRMPLVKDDTKTDEIKVQAMHQGLADAYGLACEYAGETPESITAAGMITKLTKHDPNPMVGKVFSPDGSFPKLKAKNPVRAPTNGFMCGENFQRVAAAMCSIMAFLLEDRSSDDTSADLARLLRKMEGKLLLGKGIELRRSSEFLIAISTCDESIIREQIEKVQSDMGIQS